MRMTSTGALTLAFGLCVTFAGLGAGHGAPGKMGKMPTASVALIAHGKAVAQSNGCNSCHGATYAGKKGFSPSIRATGITAKYTSAKFVRLMHTGMTEDGGHVKKPMPVYKEMPTKDSVALYSFLMAQK